MKLIINQKYRSISGQTLRDIIYATCQTCFYQQLVIPVSEHLYFLTTHTKPCFLPDYKENQDNLWIYSKYFFKIKPLLCINAKNLESSPLFQLEYLFAII